MKYSFREYYEAHIDKMNVSFREYYEAHKDKMKASFREYFILFLLENIIENTLQVHKENLALQHSQRVSKSVI